MNVVCVSWCCMCKEAGEVMDHLFLHCGLTARLWWDMFRWFGTSWTMPFAKNYERTEFQLEKAGGVDVGHGYWFHSCKGGKCGERNKRESSFSQLRSLRLLISLLHP